MTRRLSEFSLAPTRTYGRKQRIPPSESGSWGWLMNSMPKHID